MLYIELLEINLYFLSLRSPNVSVQRRGSTPLGERRRTRSASPAITDTTRVAVGSVQAALHKRQIPFKIFAQVEHEATYAARGNHFFNKTCHGQTYQNYFKRTSGKLVHKGYLFTGFTEVLDNFGRSDDDVTQ